MGGQQVAIAALIVIIIALLYFYSKVDKTVTVTKITDIKQEIAQKGQEIIQKQSELTQLRAANYDNDMILAELVSKLDKTNSDIASIGMSNVTYKTLIENTQAQIKTLLTQVESQTRERDNLQSDLNTKQAQINQREAERKILLNDTILITQRQLNDAFASQASLQQAIVDISRVIESLNNEVNTLGTNMQTRQGVENTLKTSVLQLTQSRDSAAQQLAAINAELATATNTRNTNKTAYETLDAAATSLTNQLNSVLAAQATLQSKLDAENGKVTTINAEITARTAEKADVNNKIIAANNNITDLNARIKKLTDDTAALTALNAQYKTTADANTTEYNRVRALNDANSAIMAQVDAAIQYAQRLNAHQARVNAQLNAAITRVTELKGVLDLARPRGRYVTLQHKLNMQYGMAQVVVFSDGRNVALGANATSNDTNISSDISEQNRIAWWGPKNLTDGSAETGYYSNLGTAGLIMIDLGAVYPIDSIAVLTPGGGGKNGSRWMCTQNSLFVQLRAADANTVVWQSDLFSDRNGNTAIACNSTDVNPGNIFPFMYAMQLPSTRVTNYYWDSAAYYAARMTVYDGCYGDQEARAMPDKIMNWCPAFAGVILGNLSGQAAVGLQNSWESSMESTTPFMMCEAWSCNLAQWTANKHKQYGPGSGCGKNVCKKSGLICGGGWENAVYFMA